LVDRCRAVDPAEHLDVEAERLVHYQRWLTKLGVPRLYRQRCVKDKRFDDVMVGGVLIRWELTERRGGDRRERALIESRGSPSPVHELAELCKELHGRAALDARRRREYLTVSYGGPLIAFTFKDCDA